MQLSIEFFKQIYSNCNNGKFTHFTEDEFLKLLSGQADIKTLHLCIEIEGQPLPPIQNAPPASSLLSQASPEILNALDNEPSWDFDVLKLERISQKRYQTSSNI